MLVNLVENAKKYGKTRHRDHRDQGHHHHRQRRRRGPGRPSLPARTNAASHEGTATRGVGLGLPLSRMLAREMGGDLTLERPAKFVLRLPD